MLPKFLFADNFKVAEKVFIVHTENPRFVIECSIDDFNTENEIFWFDQKPKNEEQIAKLIKEAEKYYEEEFDYMDKYSNGEAF